MCLAPRIEPESVPTFEQTPTLDLTGLTVFVASRVPKSRTFLNEAASNCQLGTILAARSRDFMATSALAYDAEELVATYFSLSEPFDSLWNQLFQY